jgi:hypothetical protein
MGSNPTQAVAIVLFLVGFVLLAGAFAGGGVICVLCALVLIGASCLFFMKIKPLEGNRE